MTYTEPVRHIALDIFPATETHCAPEGAHVLNPNSRCPKMRTNPSWCQAFDTPLEWDDDERPKRLSRCIVAGVLMARALSSSTTRTSNNP